MLEHPNVIFFELFVDFEFVCGKRENVQTVIPTVVLSLIFLRVIWEIRRVRCLKTDPEDTLQVQQSFGMENMWQNYQKKDTLLVLTTINLIAVPCTGRAR